MLEIFSCYTTDTKRISLGGIGVIGELSNKIRYVVIFMCLFLFFSFDSKAKAGDIVSEIEGYEETAWKDLQLKGHGLEDIIKKYEAKVANLEDGDPAGQEILKNLQADLKNIPPNQALNGKKISLPGFVAPLEIDQAKGTVGEFLLVPYVGACIHVPAPPSNQIVLVKPQAGKSISLERVNDPVLVSGTMKVVRSQTDLADAAYEIVDANVEMYTSPENE